MPTLPNQQITGVAPMLTLPITHDSRLLQAAMQLSAAQQEALVIATASTLARFVAACRAHAVLLDDLTRLPMTAPGAQSQRDKVIHQVS